MAKYGTVKYGQAIYGGEVKPFNLRVIIRNKANTVSLLLDTKGVRHSIAEPYRYGEKKYGQFVLANNERRPILLDVSWEYNRIGGCGNAGIVLSLPYQSLDIIEEGTEIRIDVINQQDETYDTWYRGEVATRAQNLAGASTVSIQAQGYVMQLERIRLDNVTYATANTAAIVADIIDRYVEAESDIRRTPSKGLIRAEGFVVDSITFNGSCMSAIRSLAEISGNAEWGVNNDREIFFVTRTNDVKNAFMVDELQTLNESSDFNSIVNNYKLFGASSFTRTKGNLSSQNLYGKRTAILEQAAISTNDTADQFIDGFLTDTGDPLKTVNASVGNVRKRIEGEPPQGAFEFSLLGSSPFITSRYQIENIAYSLGNGDGLIANMVGGKIKEDVTDTVAYLNYRLNQLVDV